MKKLQDMVIDANDTLIKISASHGWVIPLDGFIDEIKEEFRNYTAPGQVDSYYLGLFKSNEEKILTRLEQEYSPLDNFIKTALYEITYCYRNKKYSVCMFSLFAILESMLSDIIDPTDRKEIKYSSRLTTKIENGDFGPFGALAPLSLNYFLNYTFTASDFNGNEPSKINRHWSQHGRYRANSIDHKHILQLLAAVDLAAFVMVELNS